MTLEYTVALTEFKHTHTDDDVCTMNVVMRAAFVNPDNWSSNHAYDPCPARDMAERCWSSVVNMLMDHQTVTEAHISDYPADDRWPALYYGEFVVYDEANHVSYEVVVARWWNIFG